MKSFVACLALFVATSAAAKNGTSKIIGGNDATDGQFPFLAALYTSNNQFTCAGTIWSNRWVITAAHCVNVALIGVGSNDRSSQTMYKVQKRITNLAYAINPRSMLNDIQLIKTTTPIAFVPGVVAAATISTVSNSDFAGSNLIAPGWGYATNDGEPSENLLWTKYNMRTASSCFSQNSQSKSNYPYDSNVQICGSGTNTDGPSAVCDGDSGGPLVDDSNVVIGITSRGMATPCVNNYPDVFTKIGAFMPFIRLNTYLY